MSFQQRPLRPASSGSLPSHHTALAAADLCDGLDTRHHQRSSTADPAVLGSSSSGHSDLAGITPPVTMSHNAEADLEANAAANAAAEPFPSREQEPADDQRLHAAEGQAQGQVQVQVDHDPAQDIDDEHVFPHLVEFVRATHDYVATDPSALSFSAGDVIAVRIKLASGWWDGTLGNSRGWFPSNYVEPLSDIEDDEDGSRQALTPGAATRMLEEENANQDFGWDDAVTHRAFRAGEGEGGMNMGLGMCMGMDELTQQVLRGAGAGAGAGVDDDFGAAAAHIRSRQNGLALGGLSMVDAPVTAKDGTDDAKDSAWIPTLTPEGQVFYHNPITGEDSWTLPLDDHFMQDDQEFFTSFGGGSSSAAFSSILTPESQSAGFAPPPKRSDLPAPWVARLSDDGREWVYVNRATGETRRDKPMEGDMEEKMARLSLGSSTYRPSRIRESVEIRQRAVEEWSTRTRQALQEVLAPPTAPSMAWHMDVVGDALRNVFEAAVAGSASEEELSRAEDLNSQEGVAAALAREDTAVQMLLSSFRSLLPILRSLLSAYGYVGPLDGMNEMPRPGWTGDMALIGAIGVLSSTVHAATAARRGSDSAWGDVLRAATKLKDILSRFPQTINPNTTPAVQEVAQGKQLRGGFGVDGAGVILGGRWGFGSSAARESLRPLSDAYVAELQNVHLAFNDVQYKADTILDILRLASKYKILSLSVDIADYIDVDGDMADTTLEEDYRAYEELVVRTQNALLDLEESTASIDDFSVLLLQAVGVDVESYHGLVAAIRTSYQAISALRKLSLRQMDFTNKARLLSRIGARSTRPLSSSSPPSVLSGVSGVSRHSRRSDRPRAAHAHGLEDEFPDMLEDQSSNDVPEPLPSASTNQSQTSLFGKLGRTPSSGSSVSFTMYQTESDRGKTRRSSLMKFMTGGRSEANTRNDDDSKAPRRGPSKKLAKILGEEVIPTIPAHIPPPRAITSPHEGPWYLGPDYDADDVMPEQDPEKGIRIKAGTIEALVANLTYHGSMDTAFHQTFMLTFRTFTTGPELVDLLIKRHRIQPPASLLPVEMAEWKLKKQQVVQVRVENVFRTWLDLHWQDEDVGCLGAIERFVEDDVSPGRKIALQKHLRRRREGGDTKRIVSVNPLSPPAPIPLRSSGRGPLKLSDISQLELARQITIEDFSLFSNLLVEEFVSKARAQSKLMSPDDLDGRFPNVAAAIDNSNRTSAWVTRSILSSRDAKQRGQIIKYFIGVAAELRQLNNFTGAAALLAGLNTSAVTRLKRSWEHVPSKSIAIMNEINTLLDTSKNFRNYKEHLKAANPPMVPFIGTWLSALVFIQEGNPDSYRRGQAPGRAASSQGHASSSQTMTAPSGPSDAGRRDDNLINFAKRALTAEIIRDMISYQSQPYNLQRFKPVAEFLRAQLTDGASYRAESDVYYQLSLELEPREREEERITRMLHDSGFI